MMKSCIQVQLESYLFTLFEKSATHVTHCFNNEFSDFLFHLDILFYFIGQTYHETFHILNHSESKIKFSSIN